MARILVGVPTKNRPQLVKEAVRSVLAQSYRDVRVLVSDNRSDAAAVTEVRDFVRGLADHRVRYVLQPVDGGEYGQGRFLFGECGEEYFAILHDDDCLERDHLERAIRTLDRERDVSLFGADLYLIDELGSRLHEETRAYRQSMGRARFTEGRVSNLLDIVLQSGVFSISGTVFRSSAIRRCGLVDPDCEGLYPFEFNVFLRQAERGAIAYYTTRALVAYRWHPGQMREYSGHWSWNQAQSGTLIKLLERRRFSGSAERKRRRLLAYARRNHAYILFVAGRWPQGYRLLASALRVDPLRWQLWAYCGFAVCFPFLIRRIWGDRVKLVTPG